MPRLLFRTQTGINFAEEVVAATDTAISALKRQAGAQKIALVGYSGGGTLAMLVAARRSDVSGITTVAAPLDHGAWTRVQNVSPLAGSIDTTAYLPQLARVRQRHFVGRDDKIVPPNLAGDFIRRLGAGADARVIPIDGYSHTCCWDRNWPALLERAKGL
jgi:pimeloyl-ACP methyl ester carboxylesterase